MNLVEEIESWGQSELNKFFNYIQADFKVTLPDSEKVLGSEIVSLWARCNFDLNMFESKLKEKYA